MPQPLTLRDNTARPALETIQANQHDLHAAKVVQLLNGFDRYDVDAILGLATKQLHELVEKNSKPKDLPKYLINKKDEAILLSWQERPNGVRPNVRILTYNEVIARSGDYRATDDLPDYHLQRIQAQRDKDIAVARTTAEATARSAEVNRAASVVPIQEPVPIALVHAVVQPVESQVSVAAFNIDAADKAQLAAWVETTFNYELDVKKPITLLREQAHELVRQKNA